MYFYIIAAIGFAAAIYLLIYGLRHPPAQQINRNFQEQEYDAVANRLAAIMGKQQEIFIDETARRLNDIFSKLIEIEGQQQETFIGKTVEIQNDFVDKLAEIMKKQEHLINEMHDMQRNLEFYLRLQRKYDEMKNELAEVKSAVTNLKINSQK